jgi:hypothetical protein
MKIKIENTVEREVEITFPCYRKYGTYYYFKILNENETITVSITDKEVQIEKTNWLRSIAFDSEKSIEITPEEFSRVFIMAKNAINEL